MPSGFQLAVNQAEAYETFTRAFMDGSARLLAEGSGIGEGDAVLDLACGTGLVARHVVPLIAGFGRVVGADINAAMLEVARRKVGNDVEWMEASCDDLPFDDHSFTHVICQQGLQFVPDPVAALADSLRVLRPDGVLVATVWATPGFNPYIENQLELFTALDPSLAASVRQTTPADADDFLRSAAVDAGFGSVEVTMLEHIVEIADFKNWFIAQAGGTPWGKTVSALADREQQDLASAMAGRVEQYTTTGGVHRIPFRSYRLEARP